MKLKMRFFSSCMLAMKDNVKKSLRTFSGTTDTFSIDDLERTTVKTDLKISRTIKGY